MCNTWNDGLFPIHSNEYIPQNTTNSVPKADTLVHYFRQLHHRTRMQMILSTVRHSPVDVEEVLVEL